MLSVEQTRNQSQYAFRNGMSNVAWVAGMLRNPSKTEGFIQQTNNLNQMIHFVCEPGVVVPDSFSDGQPIKIIARMHCKYVNSRPTIELEVKRFDLPSIQDMPPRKAWEQSVRAGVPTDTARPANYREEHLDGWRVQDTGNMARLAGFVAGYKYDPPKEAGGGNLIICIRQTKDERDLMIVRYTGSDSASLARKLQIGMPLYFEGRVSVELKNTGEPADEAGVLPTHKYQYLRVRTINVAGPKQIASQPDWVQEMMVTAQSVRHKNKEQAGDKKDATASPATAAQVEAAREPVTAEVQTLATAQAVSPPGNIEIPPEVMRLIAIPK